MKIGVCLSNVAWLCKMLTLGETEWRVYGNSLYYLCNFSINLKLFQIQVYLKNTTRTSGVREDTAITEFRIKKFLNLKVTWFKQYKMVL